VNVQGESLKTMASLLVQVLSTPRRYYWWQNALWQGVVSGVQEHKTSCRLQPNLTIGNNFLPPTLTISYLYTPQIGWNSSEEGKK